MTEANNRRQAEWRERQFELHGRKMFNFMVTEEEKEKMKEYLEALREQKKLDISL